MWSLSSEKENEETDSLYPKKEWVFSKIKKYLSLDWKKTKTQKTNTVNPEEAKYLNNTKDKRKTKVARNRLPAEI